MAKVIKHHNRYDKDICIMKHIFLWLNQINIDIIKYFLENNFYLFHHHLNRLKVLNDNHVDLLKMVDWIMLVFYLYVLLLIVPNKYKFQLKYFRVYQRSSQWGNEKKEYPAFRLPRGTGCCPETVLSARYFSYNYY
jgi:hypothetical protein